MNDIQAVSHGFQTDAQLLMERYCTELKAIVPPTQAMAHCIVQIANLCAISFYHAMKVIRSGDLQPPPGLTADQMENDLLKLISERIKGGLDTIYSGNITHVYTDTPDTRTIQ